MTRSRAPAHDGHHTADFAEFTDADGQVSTRRRPSSNAGQYQWLITATTPEGRLAYLGFTGVWYGRLRTTPSTTPTKVFTITDRPVYRPEQKVKYKFWVRHAQYDQDGTSAFAGQSFTVEIHNPKGEKIVPRRAKADAYGGFEGELTLPADATLGVYQINVLKLKDQDMGGGSFRVEEYKKPEFEVTVDAPDRAGHARREDHRHDQGQVLLRLAGHQGQGEVQGHPHELHRPTGIRRAVGLVLRPGYWWFAYDYAWYPGWRDWGCPRPMPFWWPLRRRSRRNWSPSGKSASAPTAR